MYVLIPTNKKNDIGKNSFYPNVYGVCIRLKDEELHEDILRVANYQRKFTEQEQKLYKHKVETSFQCEIIHSQHHYFGEKRKFLEERKIAKVANGIVLSVFDGGIFLQMCKNNRK